MAQSLRSLRLTDAYRERLAVTRERAQATAAARWPTIEQLDDSDFTERTAAALTRSQTEAVRATAGYLTAFVSSETGRRVRAHAPDTRRYAGISRDGRPLSESLRSPIIGVLSDLKAGKPYVEALEHGKNRALRMIEMDLMHAARSALNDAMDESPDVEGWQRAVKGTCGACMGDIAVEVRTELPAIPLQVHPNCQCVTEPVMSSKAADKTRREGNLGTWSTAYDDAITAIDKTHRYPEGTAVSSVKLNSRLRKAQASFDPYERTIELNPKAGVDVRTLLHELGHKLDEAMASTRLSYASKEARKSGSPAMKALVSAMRKSEAYKRIGVAPELAYQKPYWRSSNEMFARAYAQWIHQRAKVPGEVEWSPAELRVGAQWEAEDFKPIAKAMEDLMREQGLLLE